MATKKPQDNSARLALAQQSAEAFAQSDILGTEAQDRIKEALKGSDFGLWEAVRNAWQSMYTAQRKCDDVAAAKAWSRLIAACELTKPKSAGASATRTQAKVAAQKAAHEALKTKNVEGLAVLKDELKAKAAEGDAAAFKQISMINAELKRREDEAGKAARDHLKSVQTRVVEMVRACTDVEVLARLEGLLAAAAQAAKAPAVVPVAPAATKTTKRKAAQAAKAPAVVPVAPAATKTTKRKAA